jgi:hypothetical protein
MLKDKYTGVYLNQNLVFQRIIGGNYTLYYPKIRKPFIFYLKNDCLCCRRALGDSEYSKIKLSGKVLRLHRLIYCLVNKLPLNAINKKVLLHSCDNPACCNPEHLTPGSQWENMQDRQQKNRTARGEYAGNSKLMAYQVEMIKLNTEDSIKDLAELYCVSENTIRNIKSGLTWQHLEV